MLFPLHPACPPICAETCALSIHPEDERTDVHKRQLSFPRPQLQDRGLGFCWVLRIPSAQQHQCVWQRPSVWEIPNASDSCFKERKKEPHKDWGPFLDVSSFPACSQATLMLVPCLIFLSFAWDTGRDTSHLHYLHQLLEVGLVVIFLILTLRKTWPEMIKWFCYCFRARI